MNKHISPIEFNKFLDSIIGKVKIAYHDNPGSELFVGYDYGMRYDIMSIGRHANYHLYRSDGKVVSFNVFKGTSCLYSDKTGIYESTTGFRLVRLKY